MSTRANAAEPVQVKYKGKVYTGTFSSTGGKVTVTSPFGTKTIQLGGLTPENAACVLLKELVQTAEDQ